MHPPPPIFPLTSPSQPTVDALAEACEEAGFLSIGIAAAMLAGGFILGVIVGGLIGLRFRVKAAIEKMLDVLKKAQADAGDDGGDDENDMEGEDEESAAKEALDHFLSRDWIGGLDDHPETVLSPILLYQINKAKDAMRARKQLEAQLIAHGYEPNHMDTLDEEGKRKLMEEMSQTKVQVASNVGSVAGKVRKYGATQNSTRILVNTGARFSSIATLTEADAANAEAKAAQTVRERLKVIDQHLGTTSGIDTTRADHKQSSVRLKAGHGGLVKNALEKAKETKFKPYGGDGVKRSEEMATYAARGRSRVAPPLDHSISAHQERARRASCGGGGAARRASCTRGGGGGGGRPPKPGSGGDADGDIGDKMRSAQSLLQG